MTSDDAPQALKKVSEEEKMEDGFVDVEEAAPAAVRRSNGKSAASESKRLSTVSKAYDLDGDGKLNPAEQAMRDMDKTGRGYLTNEKVYELMQNHLDQQREMFKLKKFLIGAFALIVILALANLGTGFAAANLAKDTTTNTQGELVDKNTGEAVATAEAISEYTVDESSGQVSRKLNQACGNANGGGADCVITSFTLIASDKALEMLAKCRSGKHVTLTYQNNGHSTPITVCHSSYGNDPACAHDFTDGDGPQGSRNPIAGEICQANDEKLYIKASLDTPDMHTISASDADIVSSDVLTFNEGEACVSNTECDSDLKCKIDSSEPGAGAFYPCDISNVASCVGSEVGDVCSVLDDSGATSCGECNLQTEEHCDFRSNRPTCTNELGFSTCGCKDDDDCAHLNVNPEDKFTCGEPSCEVGKPKYCSEDHDFDAGCGTCQPLVEDTSTTQAIVECGANVAAGECCDNSDCPDTDRDGNKMFCDFGFTHGAGVCPGDLQDDGTPYAGVCSTKPDVYTEAVDPVCGCDFMNYISGTAQANAAGVNVAYQGYCACASDPCDEASGSTCFDETGACVASPDPADLCANVRCPDPGCDPSTGECLTVEECICALTHESNTSSGVCVCVQKTCTEATDCGTDLDFDCVDGGCVEAAT